MACGQTRRQHRYRCFFLCRYPHHSPIVTILHHNDCLSHLFGRYYRLRAQHVPSVAIFAQGTVVFCEIFVFRLRANNVCRQLATSPKIFSIARKLMTSVFRGVLIRVSQRHTRAPGGSGFFLRSTKRRQKGYTHNCCSIDSVKVFVHTFVYIVVLALDSVLLHT